MSNARRRSCDDKKGDLRGNKKSKMAGKGAEIADTEHKNVLNEEDLERQHFMRILAAFMYYKNYASSRVDQAHASFKSIPKYHQDLLPDFIPHLKQIRHCIDHNFEIIKLMLDSTRDMFENSSEMINDEGSEAKAVVKMDMEKVVTTLKQFFRDWSSGGKEERDACYKPIIEEIKQLYPNHKCNADGVDVLVPGAGLGRLAFEIASNGYRCQGNEFSLFMLIASHFVLNKSTETDMFTLYPWIHAFSNNKSSANQISPIHFPDINPMLLSPDAQFSMVAGDFLEVYTDEASWDCVATSYFIDTANNILAYIEKIYHILKPGGHWINLGPLLYHFENMPNQDSIEISYDVLRRVILDMGFKMLKENTSVRSTYIQDPASMMRYSYECAFFVCQKPSSSQESMQEQL
ncbi:carnosine N-methyltransferase [Strongylocentrotus purpuratus]|uniref:Carnosine N-methyltransferase n=1 Tax=Strongylocentrotus purpuratus TaxID=7668 RepID=A0A7M7GFL2_STRPU|nr:carnosine N-methyltransferase [Strongylocentrotus purpuratus]